MIVVEGPDGTGKTTLAEHLSQKFKLEYRRFPKDEVSGPELSTANVDWWEVELAKNELAVYDRCVFISELPYQLVSHSRPLLFSGARMMNGLRDLWAAEPFFIFCATAWETQLENIRQSGRYENLPDNVLQKISWAYDSIFAMWENALFENVRRYDFRISDHSALEKLISRHIERRRRG